MSAAKLKLLFLTAVLFTPLASGAQDVDTVVAAHVAARGGQKALAAVRTLRMSGHAFAGPGRQAIVRREIARPGRIRTEFEFQGTTGVYVWDGEKGSQVSPLDGSLEAKPMTDTAAALSAEQADFEGPLVDWKAKGHQVELVGKADLPAGPAHELKVTLKSGVVRRLFLDAKSGQLVRSESTRTLRGHEVTVETLYSDYRATRGVRFARMIDIGVKGRPTRLRIEVERVEVNPKLDAARFTLPR